MIKTSCGTAFIINGAALICLIAAGTGIDPYHQLKDDSAWIFIIALGIYEIYLGIKLGIRIVNFFKRR